MTLQTYSVLMVASSTYRRCNIYGRIFKLNRKQICKNASRYLFHSSVGPVGHTQLPGVSPMFVQEICNVFSSAEILRAAKAFPILSGEGLCIIIQSWSTNRYLFSKLTYSYHVLNKILLGTTLSLIRKFTILWWETTKQKRFSIAFMKSAVHSQLKRVPIG